MNDRTLEDKILIKTETLFRKLQQHVREISKPYDLDENEKFFLGRLLVRGEGVPVKKLCKDLSIPKSTSSKVLRRLTEKNWIVKKNDLTDMRKTRIYFKDKKKKKKVLEARRKVQKWLFKNFKKNEMEDLDKKLSKLLKKFKK